MVLAADGKPLDEHPVQAHVEVVGSAHAPDVVVVVALEANPDAVLAVGRKVMAHRHAALRPERQVLAHPLVLNQVEMDVVPLDGRTLRGNAHGSGR